MAVPGLRNRPLWRRCDILCTSGPPIIGQIMATKVGNLLKLIRRSRASTRSEVKSLVDDCLAAFSPNVEYSAVAGCVALHRK